MSIDSPPLFQGQGHIMQKPHYCTEQEHPGVALITLLANLKSTLFSPSTLMRGLTSGLSLNALTNKLTRTLVEPRCD